MNDKTKHLNPQVPDTKAVAIESKGTFAQPTMTAKGSGFEAEKILDIAFASGVKVRRDKELTDILSAFDVESPIPLEALGAVSIILDYVYKANQSKAYQANKQGKSDSVDKLVK